MAGRRVNAMIEGKIEQEDVYVARTYKDAPGVDGYLFINTDECLDKSLMSGDFVTVTITGSNEYDLIGEMED
jgi:ribosomal protein S12 methylthiotransferase